MLLGIDIGTSSAKAVLYDPAENSVVAVAGQEYPIHRPAPGLAEQNPAEWWGAVVATVRKVTAEHKDVAGIGFSGQMHGVVLRAADGTVLHPAIIWADQRSAPYCEPLQNALPNFIGRTGTVPAAGFMGPTLLWTQANRPELLDAAHAVLLPKDDIRYQMTGVMSTEPTDAASTALFDVRAGVWATDVIDAAKLNPALFPAVHPSAGVVGELTAQAAEAFGLRAGVPVVSGAADQPAQAVANGILRPGALSVTVGSGGQVFAPLADDFQTDPRLHVFNHAVPGQVYALGAILAAGLSLRWLRDLVGTDYATLSAAAAEVPPGADGLLFQPYINGERTPHMDPHARGSFIGLTSYHTLGHMARAVIEGVAFAVREATEITLEIGGRAENVVGSGGSIETPLWRAVLTDVLNTPLRKSLAVEQAGVGAAMLAGVGVGVFEGFDAVPSPDYDHPTEPNPANRALYDDRYAQFKAMYGRLRDDFHRLGKGQ